MFKYHNALFSKELNDVFFVMKMYLYATKNTPIPTVIRNAVIFFYSLMNCCFVCGLFILYEQPISGNLNPPIRKSVVRGPVRNFVVRDGYCLFSVQMSKLNVTRS